MDKLPISNLLETTMQKAREMVDANTIVGEPIRTQDGITLIPISKISFGFVGGGTDFAKKQEPKNAFGGGIGAAVNVVPVAFVVINGESAKLMHVSPPSASTVDRIIDTVPEIFDKITDFIDKGKDKSDDEGEQAEGEVEGKEKSRGKFRAKGRGKGKGKSKELAQSESMGGGTAGGTAGGEDKAGKE